MAAGVALRRGRDQSDDRIAGARQVQYQKDGSFDHDGCDGGFVRNVSYRDYIYGGAQNENQMWNVRSIVTSFY